jgi:hypothetical protein
MWGPADRPGKLRILEVEIVVQILAAVRPEEGLVRLLVVPGFVGVAGLHGGDDVRQARMIATPRELPRDDILLAHMRLANMLYDHSRLGRQGCRTFAHAISQPHRKLRIVEDADALDIEISGHPPGVAHRRQRPGDHQPVIA